MSDDKTKELLRQKVRDLVEATGPMAAFALRDALLWGASLCTTDDSRWTPVFEEMPEHARDVLVVSPDDRPSRSGYAAMTIAMWLDDDKDWSSVDGVGRVSHWHPLPAPPWEYKQ